MDGSANFVTSVNYVSKMFMKLTTGYSDSSNFVQRFDVLRCIYMCDCYWRFVDNISSQNWSFIAYFGATKTHRDGKYVVASVNEPFELDSGRQFYYIKSPLEQMSSGK
jgi:hypothetical protein